MTTKNHRETNLVELVKSGRRNEASSLLLEGMHLVGATGERSTTAALYASEQLYAGDFVSTIYFMNYRHPWLLGQTPLQKAEESDKGLEFVIDMVSAIAAGVYV